MYTGAAAGSVFCPPGAIVGSIVGYIVANQTYDSCVAILREARLAEEEAAIVIRLCYEAIEIMEEQRQAFEEHVDTVLAARRHEAEQCFAVLDAASLQDDPAMIIEALADLAATFGHSLKFARFEDFDAFMLDPNSGPLIL